MSAEQPQAETAPAVIDEHPFKVFTGNLSFKTTEEELKEFFAPAGAVTKVNIITRGTRSLGYGFVAFSSPEECEAAVERCHKKELDGREINVEVAKPKSELAAAKKERAAASGEKKKRKRRPKKTDELTQKETEDGVIVSHGGDAKDDGTIKKKKRKPKKKAPLDPDAPRPPPRPRRVPTGEPSKTTVFVANLPFTLDDAGLSAVFAGYAVKTAKVVTRRGTGRSKGFGFVDFETEDDQQRAVAAVFESESRELSIKVALSEEKPAEEGAAAPAEVEAEA